MEEGLIHMTTSVNFPLSMTFIIHWEQRLFHFFIEESFFILLFKPLQTTCLSLDSLY